VKQNAHFLIVTVGLTYIYQWVKWLLYCSFVSLILRKEKRLKGSGGHVERTRNLEAEQITRDSTTLYNEEPIQDVTNVRMWERSQRTFSYCLFWRITTYSTQGQHNSTACRGWKKKTIYQATFTHSLKTSCYMNTWDTNIVWWHQSHTNIAYFSIFSTS
jgi:hypothetical protein